MTFMKSEHDPDTKGFHHTKAKANFSWTIAPTINSNNDCRHASRSRLKERAIDRLKAFNKPIHPRKHVLFNTESLLIA